ncbi:MAG: hypothetical protein WA049_03145 [Ferribacterium limneticum]|jgi:hypothetical protein
MLNNTLIFTISLLLALATLGSPLPMTRKGKGIRIVALVALYLGAVLGTLWIFDGKSALAILELGLLLTGIAKLIAMNFRIVHSARYPKHRRCY